MNRQKCALAIFKEVGIATIDKLDKNLSSINRDGNVAQGM